MVFCVCCKAEVSLAHSAYQHSLSCIPIIFIHMQTLEEHAQRDAEAAADTILELERETEELRREFSEDKRRWEDQLDVWSLYVDLTVHACVLKSRAPSWLL